MTAETLPAEIPELQASARRIVLFALAGSIFTMAVEVVWGLMK